MEAFRYQSLKVFAKDLWNQLEIPAPIPTTPANQPSWVYIFQGGGRKHTLVYQALFPLNLITELVNPPRNTFGLAELQLLFYFGQ